MYNMTDKNDKRGFKDIIDLLTGDAKTSKKFQLGVIQVLTVGFLIKTVTRVIRSVR